jgi:leader peptidase (prepilin peptidase)/N-methyltransferase
MTELAQPAVFASFSLVLGLCIGSFLNVVIHRLPKMMEREWQEQCAELRNEEPPALPAEHGIYNLLRPRSHCPKCNHAITALENIPVVSWAFLRGRCSECKTRISARYPLVELLTGLASAGAALHFGFGFAALGAMFFLWCMIALTFIDFDTQLLPDSITLPLLWAGLLLNLGGGFVDLKSSVIGAAAGYLSLWSVYWMFKLATGKEGMGYGDFKLLAAIGAWLGWAMLPLVILLSSMVGAVVGISLIVLARHGRNVPIPFGPYLAAGGVVAMFWGQQLTRTWLNVLY